MGEVPAFPQVPLSHSTSTFCYAGLGTEIKMSLAFISSLFSLFWTARVGQGPHIN